MSSNGVIAKIVLYDLDLLFECQHFKIVISLKLWKLAQNVWKSFRDFDNCYQMMSLLKLYSVILTYFLINIFMVKLFEWLFECCLSAKIPKKKQLGGFEHLQSNSVSSVFLLLNLDLNFQGQTFQVGNSTSKGSKLFLNITNFLIKMTFYDLFLSKWLWPWL